MIVHGRLTVVSVRSTLSFGWGIPFVTVILLSQLQTRQRGGLADRKSEHGNSCWRTKQQHKKSQLKNGGVREILESSQ